jgi:hypothetical protein
MWLLSAYGGDDGNDNDDFSRNWLARKRPMFVFFNLVRIEAGK